MQIRLLFAALIAATPILALSPAAFPASDDPACVRATAGARQVQRKFMSLMRQRDDEGDRNLAAHAVPRVRSREVKQVSERELCEKAREAYRHAVRDDSSDGKVHIIHIGGRFIVVDPDLVRGSRQHLVTFDSSFTRPLAVVTD